MAKPITISWLLAGLGVFFVLMAAWLLPLSGIEGQGFDRFLGRFHPLILHFPVACLCFVALFQIVSFAKPLKHLKFLVGPMLILAAISACITVLLGLLLGMNEGHSGALIDRHRTRGIGVAIFSCISAAAYFTAKHTKSRSAWTGYIASFVTAIGLMGLTAHDGGSLVHGPTYLADHAPKILQPLLTTHIPKSNKNAPSSEELNDNQSPLSPELLARFDNEVGNFFGGYCSRCHGDSKQEANVQLDNFDETFSAHNSAYNWRRVMGVLGAHRMPPENSKQPSAQQRDVALKWIEEALEATAFAKRANQENAPLRRLNRREINHSYQDIFDVDVDFVTRLPADAKSEHGYDTDADLLMLSMSDLRLYHDVARQAVETYVHFGERKETRDLYFIEMEDVYHFGRQEGARLSYDRSARALPKPQIELIKSARASSPPVYRDRQYGPLPHGPIPNGDVPGVGEGRGFARLHEQFMLLHTPHKTGEVTVRVHAAMTPGQNNDNSVPRLRLEAGWRNIQSLRVKVIGEKDVTASKDAPEIIEFKFQLEEVIAPETARWDDSGDDRWVLLVLSNYARHENGILAGSIYGQIDMDLPSSATEELPYQEQAAAAAEQQNIGLAHWKKGGVPYLYLDAVEAEITPAKSNPNAPWILPLGSTSDVTGSPIESEAKIVRNVLIDFLPKAFRRTVSTVEINHYETLFVKMRENGDPYEDSARETLASALISPAFLYIGYPAPDAGDESNAMQIRAKNNYLASRLSYFLWSSIPDQQLRDLAENEKLTDPATLSHEVDRMLADHRSLRMMRTFATQWMQLHKLSNTSVSEEIYPEYGPQFADLLNEESISTFKDNFQNNRDARELFSSEYMMLNDQLARHYGINGVTGGDIRRVHVGDTKQRAGLLTQGSVLTINSNGQDSHPLKRGVWLLERILNDPPPPPPPSVPELDTNNPLLAGMTLKQQIEHHRSLSACSGCHEKIDPWGVIFENFDATGRWRDTVEVNGETVPVDASSFLVDGTKLDNIAELAEYLDNDPDESRMKSLVYHYMVYALGRDLDVLDEAEAEVIYSSFRASGYKLPALTKFIVQSDAFTNRETMNSNGQRE